jgi:DNA-damage-inducible protein D
MLDQNITSHYVTFESIKHQDDNGNEYWNARQLAKILGYSVFRNFIPVIAKAKEACKKSNQNPDDHIAEMRNMVQIGSGATRELEDVRLSKYACYLIVQNADPSKEVVAQGQTYFAIQTRRQELQEQIQIARTSRLGIS